MLSGGARVVGAYARVDGEPLARELVEDLPSDLGVWMDRREMAGDERWWQQIKDAIDESRYVLAVMTPGAIVSRTTRDEWLYARRRGVRICPVKGVEDAALNYAELPRWM